MPTVLIRRVGQNHAFIGVYGVHTVFIAGKSPYARSYTVQIYGSGQPYLYGVVRKDCSLHALMHVVCIYACMYATCMHTVLANSSHAYGPK